MQNKPDRPAIGHNSLQMTMTVKVKLFNSMGRFDGGRGPFQTLTLPVGATVGDIVDHLHLPVDEIFLVLRNGRDVSEGRVGDLVNMHAELGDGDCIAFSGPVPYSFGYGAPVV